MNDDGDHIEHDDRENLPEEDDDLLIDSEEALIERDIERFYEGGE